MPTGQAARGREFGENQSNAHVGARAEVPSKACIELGVYPEPVEGRDLNHLRKGFQPKIHKTGAQCLHALGAES